MNRRGFVRALSAGGVFGLSQAEEMAALAMGKPRITAPPPDLGPRVRGAVSLVVLHTNDTHSRMDPFPEDGGPFAGLGGAARRATVIRHIREANDNVLLLDSGDIFQGTPYFNFFGGELEFRVMTAMGYDAATLGNHDFDNGVEGLVAMLPQADFDIVSANYDVSGSALEGRVKPYVVREFGGVKVGILGLGIAFQGLVLARLHEGVEYRDPVVAARTTAQELRAAGCALVICLSHLGYRYRDPNRPSDRSLAVAVPEIDLILGGHTHTFLDQAEVFDQGQNGLTLVNQTGWGGMRLGRIDIAFDDRGQPSGRESTSYDIDKRFDQ